MGARSRTVWRAAAAGALLLGVALGAGDPGAAQTLHHSGQSVQPVYEGWSPNPDGTYTMWFGYMNRNYEEQPHIPVGPANYLDSGPEDRGQPTFFYPRRQFFVFGVEVPADWGQDRDLVWTVTAHGQSRTAIGSLWATWVVDEGVWRANRGSDLRGRYAGEELTNQPPAASIVGSTSISATVGEPVPVTVAVADDGQPGPREIPLRPRPPVDPLPNDLPIIGGPRGGGGGGAVDQNRVSPLDAYDTGLAVTWVVHRGPADVAFDPRVTPLPREGGQVTAAARFSEPGEYVIRAAADDSSYLTPADITVSVAAAE